MTPKIKCTNGVLVLISIILVGYALIIFSTLFGKSSQYSDIVGEQLTELEFSNNMLHTQLSEKEKEIVKLHDQLASSGKSDAAPAFNPNDLVVRSGVIILGMHRSGTSVLGGLVNKMGLQTGGPLIEAAEDNAKGFFERIDVVLQNDAFFKLQGVHYAWNTCKYDARAGLVAALSNEAQFREGERALEFLNSPASAPWMLKDPRLCVTLRSWLPLLSSLPAVLYSYRHPLDVALSMHKREFEQFKVAKGLRMWYVYNRRAIEQSRDLCRVATSHRAVMQQPQAEFDRIFVELRQCGVAVPRRLTPEDIASFIDSKLQHGHSTLKDTTTCSQDMATLRPPESWPTTEPEHVALYREVMRLYCGLEDGSALRPGFLFDQTIKDV